MFEFLKDLAEVAGHYLALISMAVFVANGAVQLWNKNTKRDI